MGRYLIAPAASHAARLAAELGMVVPPEGVEVELNEGSIAPLESNGFVVTALDGGPVVSAEGASGEGPPSDGAEAAASTERGRRGRSVKGGS